MMRTNQKSSKLLINLSFHPSNLRSEIELGDFLRFAITCIFACMVDMLQIVVSRGRNGVISCVFIAITRIITIESSKGRERESLSNSRMVGPSRNDQQGHEYFSFFFN